MLGADLHVRDAVQLGSVGHRIAGWSGTPRCPGARPMAVSRGRGKGEEARGPTCKRERERERESREGG
jgi:hypothetical protein